MDLCLSDNHALARARNRNRLAYRSYENLFRSRRFLSRSKGLRGDEPLYGSRIEHEQEQEQEQE